MIEAAIWLCMARFSILVLRFVWIGRYLGPLHPPSARLRDDTSKERTAQEVAWAIHRACRLLPLRLVCLPRALAGWQVINLRGIPGRVHCGASNAMGEKMATHAWLDACGVEVTGYQEAEDFVEIGFYARRNAIQVSTFNIQEECAELLRPPTIPL